MICEEQTFFKTLSKYPNFQYPGHLMRTPRTFHEKGHGLQKVPKKY